MTKPTNKQKIKRSIAEFGFWAFVLISALIFLGTAFLPIILSVIHGNWLYMAMYHVIPVPIIFEMIVFIIVFKIIAD